MDGMLDDLKQVTDKSDEFSLTITELKNSSAAFKEATDKFNHILVNIEAGEGTIGKLISDTTLYGNMNSLVDEIRAFVKDVKDNPSKYMKAYRKSKK
jgi:phospholipid/cholesterol/gamma-HCH transport system substrate-binding protein